MAINEEEINYDELLDNEDESDDVEINDPKEVREESDNPPAPKPETIDIQKKRIKLLNSYKLFPEELCFYKEQLTIGYLKTLDEGQLDELFEEVQITIGCRRSSSMISAAYFGAIQGVEAYGPWFGLRLEGLTTALQKSNEVVKDLCELQMKYEDIVFVEPEYRLLYNTVNAIGMYHKLNTETFKTKLKLTTVVKEDIINEFKDL